MVQFNKIIIGGSLVGTERWSVGLTYIPAGLTPVSYVETQDDLNSWAADIASYLNLTAHAALERCLSAQGKMDTVIAQKYGSDSRLTRQSVTADPDQVGTSAMTCPAQTAVVFSSATGRVGASYRGRTYWPALAPVLNTSGRLSSTTNNISLATEFVDVINEIGSLAPVGGPARFGVFSPTLDVVTPVTQIRVGDILDTQGRRRDDFVESYESVTL